MDNRSLIEKIKEYFEKFFERLINGLKSEHSLSSNNKSTFGSKSLFFILRRGMVDNELKVDRAAPDMERDKLFALTMGKK